MEKVPSISMDTAIAAHPDKSDAVDGEAQYAANLRTQLESLRRIRSVLSGLNSSLDRARASLAVRTAAFHSDQMESRS